MTDEGDQAALLRRAHGLLDRLEAWLPEAPPAIDFATQEAFLWRTQPPFGGRLLPVARPQPVALNSLLGIDRQKAALVRNTRQFLHGLPANNALLWGARGTGKSSLVKALLTAFAGNGLRLIEIAKTGLPDLPLVMAMLHGRPERFILFCDDLAFAEGEAGYPQLKAVLEGSVSAPPENVLIYATANRRHLLPEHQAENQDSRLVDGELHHGDAVEEKISLSERFGLWLAFHPFNQAQYLEMIAAGLASHGLALDETARAQALRYALERGSRSGRVAAQFSRDWIGRQRLYPQGHTD